MVVDTASNCGGIMRCSFISRVVLPRKARSFTHTHTHTHTHRFKAAALPVRYAQAQVESMGPIVLRKVCVGACVGGAHRSKRKV